MSYKLNSDISEPVLDPEVCMPKQTLTVKVDIPIPWGGGRCMTDESIELHEYNLVQTILGEVKIKLEEYVRVIDPFGDRRMPKE